MSTVLTRLRGDSGCPATPPGTGGVDRRPKILGLLRAEWEYLHQATGDSIFPTIVLLFSWLRGGN